jgi:hypothetical protein
MVIASGLHHRHHQHDQLNAGSHFVRQWLPSHPSSALIAEERS